MSKFFKDLKAGLEEIIEYQKGKITLRTNNIDLPKPPFEYKAADIKKIREKKHYSRGVFAKLLNVSPQTIKSWERGLKKPSGLALRLLEIIDQGIYPIQYKQ